MFQAVSLDVLQILLQCESLAIQHKGVAPVVIMSLNITTRLVALPTRVSAYTYCLVVFGIWSCMCHCSSGWSGFQTGSHISAPDCCY